MPPSASSHAAYDWPICVLVKMECIGVGLVERPHMCMFVFPPTKYTYTIAGILNFRSGILKHYSF